MACILYGCALIRFDIITYAMYGEILRKTWQLNIASNISFSVFDDLDV